LTFVVVSILTKTVRMARPRLSTTSLLAAALPLVNAQLSGWLENQVNASICSWEQPRAALIRDTVYLDGGNLYWLPGLNDENYGPAVPDFNQAGNIFSYNLSRAFEPSTNQTEILTDHPVSKARGGQGTSDGIAGKFVDGGLLANDAQFFLFGGVGGYSLDALEGRNSDEILVFEGYSYVDGRAYQGPIRESTVDNNVNSYVAYGAAASAPSEQLAWYFSGLESPDRGPILDAGNSTYKATEVSNRLITVNMELQGGETWSEKDLGDGIEGRANPEAVWVPVGERGILVVLGGVVYPEWAGNRTHQSDDPEANAKDSPSFMRDIDIYDVANGTWYKQPTTSNGPDARTRGCAVVAHAADRSSFNIYYYGGFDGIHADEPFHDDVWVLSLPSFTWTRINEGNDVHARAGHKCFTPYADQMMVFGGYKPLQGSRLACLDEPVVVFNLSSGEWMDSYDPTKFDDYGVPEAVRSVIGGDASGGATLTEPEGNGWATSDLGAIFATPYDFNKITTWSPFSADAQPTESSRPNLPTDDGDNGGGDGLPDWVAPVLGVVLGLIFLTGCLIAFFLWRRRSILKRRPSDAGTEDTGMRILAWIRGQGQQPVEKAPTVTTSEDTPASPEMRDARTVTSSPLGPLPYTPSHVEAPDTQVAELGDTSPPVELSAAGLVALNASHRRSGRGHPRTLSNPSDSSFGMHGEFSSNASQSSGLPQSHAAHSGRVDSPPPTGVSPEPPYNRVTSGVSSVTEREASHLRQISEASAATVPVHHFELPGYDAPVATTPDIAPVDTTPFETPAEMPESGNEGLISPPTATETPAEDYIAAGSASSPTRRSVFHENQVDLGKIEEK
jgi:hypothetical protein